jgi:hypothetical protein
MLLAVLIIACLILVSQWVVLVIVLFPRPEITGECVKPGVYNIKASTEGEGTLLPGVHRLDDEHDRAAEIMAGRTGEGDEG